MKSIIISFLVFSITLFASGDKNIRSVKRIDKVNKRSLMNVLQNNVDRPAIGTSTSINSKRKLLKTLAPPTSRLDSVIYLQEGNRKKYQVSFNNVGRIVNEIIQSEDQSSNWLNDFRRTLSYNDDNKQTVELFEYYDLDLSKWEYDWRYMTEYENDGTKEIWIDQVWNIDDGVWNSRWRQTINIMTNEMTFFEELWDDGLNDWMNDYQAVINYDDNGNELNYFGEIWIAESGQWANSWKDTSFYDNTGKLIGYKSYYWDSGTWYAWDNESYYYNDDGNLSEYLIRDIDFSGENWIEYQRVNYYYDDAENLITEFLDNLDPEYYNYRTTYQYDENNNMVRGINEAVDPTNGAAEPATGDMIFADIYANYSFYASQLDAFYSVPTSVKLLTGTISDNFSLSQNYPNPFNPATTIVYNLPSNELFYNKSTKLRVYDILGNEIVTLVNEVQTPGLYEIKFDGNLLSSGQYFYRLTVGDYSLTKSMLLLK